VSHGAPLNPPARGARFVPRCVAAAKARAEIDTEGSVTADYDSSDDTAIERLLADTARLNGTPPANAVTGAGRELFSSLGCAGCHNDSQLAPPLAGLLGTRVMFERGGAVLVDDAYIRESIATPGTRVVAGYPSSMPTCGSLLSSAQLASVGDRHEAERIWLRCNGQNDARACPASRSAHGTDRSAARCSVE
jgi:hypothetical protein